MLGTILPNRGLPLPEGLEKSFDWASRLSIDMIRQHTKTDDVPGVTDEQLVLYRSAALESAELYTGFLLSGQRNIIEPIQWSPTKRLNKPYYVYRLQHPVADGVVYVYGGPQVSDNFTFHVIPGTRKIRVPIKIGLIDLSNCCDPCSKHYFNEGMMAAYRAGFQCPDEVPAGIVLGMLQFIAWVVEHPGDEVLTQRNKFETRAGGIQGTNNIAMVSGALETWRQYDPEAI